MKSLNKILIVLAIFGCFIFNLTLADDGTDCSRFGALSYKDKGSFDIVDTVRGNDKYEYTNFLTVEEQEKIIKKDDLNTAILNLKKYCCENKKGDLGVATCKDDSPYFNDNALDSPYLFDHLFDVIMRRLNGLNGDKNIYTKTKMTLDDKGEEWRNRIDKQAKSTAGSTPQTIITQYQQTRKQSPSNLGYDITKNIYGTFGSEDNLTFLRYVSGKAGEESEALAKTMKNYDRRTLYDRYINAGALSEYFYALLGAPEKDKMQTIARLKDKTGSGILLCDDIIADQIDSENTYVALVIQRSSNLFLSNFLEGYISYLYDRQLKLQKLRKDASDRFLDVTRAIECLQHVCTKSG